MTEIIKFPRNGRAGYFAVADLPQREPIAESALSTGWWELDQIFKFYTGQFVVVTGVAGSGKSTFVLNLLVNQARQNLRSFMYVPEGERNIVEKLRGIYGPGTEFDVRAAVNFFIQSSNFEHYQDEPRTIDWVLEQAWHAWRDDDVRFVLIDPWNELERARQRDELLTDYIGRCIMRMKMFCAETGVTLFIIAHPTKAHKENPGRKVQLGDIEGSMNWYNKADNGLIIEREDDGTAIVISAKVREEPDAGKRGRCFFQVDAAGRFTPQYGGVDL